MKSQVTASLARRHQRPDRPRDREAAWVREVWHESARDEGLGACRQDRARDARAVV